MNNVVADKFVTRIREKFSDQIHLHTPIIYINYPDIERVNICIYSLKNESNNIKEWNPAFNTCEFSDIIAGRQNSSIGGQSLFDFLKDIYNNVTDKNNIYVLRNILHLLKSDEALISILQLISNNIKHKNNFDHTLIIVSDEKEEYPEVLDQYTSYFDSEDFTPNKDEIRDCIEKHYTACYGNVNDDQEIVKQIKELKGLQLYEIDELIDINIYEGNSSDSNILTERKNEKVKSSGFLEIIEPDEIDKVELGGYQDIKKNFAALKERLNNREKYAKYGIPNPKGYLLYGPPGCGKSQMAMLIAKETGFNRSLYRLEIGKLMGQYVGQSEANLRKCLKLLDASAPCILWIDEIEKALAGTSSKNNEEAYSMRMLQSLLTWMQERKTMVFIVATANELKLRPELIRRGRFDAHFEVGYPEKAEVVDIFNLYLGKKNRGELCDNLKIDTDFVNDLEKLLAEVYLSNIDPDKYNAAKKKDDENKKGGATEVPKLLDKFIKDSGLKKLAISGSFIKSVVEGYIIERIDSKEQLSDHKNALMNYIKEQYEDDLKKKIKNEKDQ